MLFVLVSFIMNLFLTLVLISNIYFVLGAPPRRNVLNEAKMGRSYGVDAVRNFTGMIFGGNPYQEILTATGYGARKLSAKSDVEFADMFSRLTNNNDEHLLQAAEVAAGLGKNELAKILIELCAAVAQAGYQFDTASQRLSSSSNVSTRTGPYLSLFSTTLSRGYKHAFELLLTIPDLSFNERLEAFKLALSYRGFDGATINHLFLDGQSGKAFTKAITGTNLDAQLTLIAFTVTNQRYEVFKRIIKTFAAAGKRYSQLTDGGLDGHSISLFEQVLKNGINWPESTGRMLLKIVKVFPEMPYDNVTTAARMLHDLEKFDDFARVMTEINALCTTRFYENQRRDNSSPEVSDDGDDDDYIGIEDLSIDETK